MPASRTIFFTATVLLLPLSASADSSSHHPQVVDDSVIAQQRQQLAVNTEGKGFGPQSPRDIDQPVGNNPITFASAPDYRAMNLCNIHFHNNAEHKGGDFTTYAGNGDGKGHGSGYRYNGELTRAQLAPVKAAVCSGKEGHSLKPGDTLEVHFVHSSAAVKPGATLGACLSESVKNPQLRVETQVIVLANDAKALDFGSMTTIAEANGFYQAPNIPQDMGTPVQYSGSTTGPSYNEQGSPFQVTWNVRPKVAVVNIDSVARWCDSNVFEEDHAHAVRNLVKNPALLSPLN
jgi:hypothetical protein